MEQDRPNSEKEQNKAKQALSRRNALKTLAAAAGAMALSVVPDNWEKPVVEVGVLPAHAQASAAATPTPVPTPPTGAPPLGTFFAVMGTVSDGDQIVVFPTANTNLPNPEQKTVPGLPSGARPHGVAYFGDAGGLVSDFRNSRVFVVDLRTNSLVDTITPTAYNGTGTIAIAPGSGYALASGEFNKLSVIQSPFTASSTITTVSLPGRIPAYETQAIVFNTAGRAFVYHIQGISVLDPPYDTITFTISAPFNITGGAIAISPDGNTLLTTDWETPTIYIFKAPFSASSTPETLIVVTNLETLDLSNTDSDEPAGPSGGDSANPSQVAVGFVGIRIIPDNTKALVCSSTLSTPKVYALSAPFSGASTVEEIPLPGELTSGRGFEDIGLSYDGNLAIITGGSDSGAPAAFIQAPFTAAGAKVFAVNIAGGGRGAGAVRFQPANP